MTIRVRLAALCALLVTLSGGLVLVGVLLLTQHALHVHRVRAPLQADSRDPDVLRSEQFALLGQAQELEDRTLSDVRGAGLIGLGALGLASIGIGWLVSGRLLRPATELARTAQQISAATLDQRFASDGPPDELKAIADAFDGMLDRLDDAFERQKRFIADASHELRTPFAVLRTQVDVALDSRGEGVEELRARLESLGATLDRGGELVNAMLALSRAETITRRERVDLAELAAETVTSLPGVGDLDVRPDLAPAATEGDPVLLAQLVGNLLQNAITHNVAGGRLELQTATQGATALLRIANDGERIAPEAVGALFERFHRGAAARRSGGFGIGLSVAQTIVHSHGGTITAAARPEGGLCVRVALRSV